MPFFTMKLQIVIEINNFGPPAINKVICCGNLVPNLMFIIEHYLNKNVTIEQEFFNKLKDFMPINKIIISFEDKGEDYILDKLFKIFPSRGIFISQGVEDFYRPKYEKIFSGLC